MSRQIKFRVWDKEKRRFISSNYFAIGLDGTLIQHNICYNNDPDDTWDDSWNEELDEDKYVIEQFTGLLDSEGKEIYEGDILAFLEGDFQRGQDGFDDRLEVVWDGKNSKFGANFYSKYGGEGCTGKEQCLSEYNKEIIIIGNTHQNHELLAA